MNSKLKIAIVGAGFSGLALAWYLLEKNPAFNLTLYDPSGVGGKVSSLSAGMLYKFAGLHAKKNRLADLGEKHTLELVDIASSTFKNQLSYLKESIRPAFTLSQKEDFLLCAKKYPDEVTLLNQNSVYSIDPNLPKAPAFLFNEVIPLIQKAISKAFSLLLLKRPAIC